MAPITKPIRRSGRTTAPAIDGCEAVPWTYDEVIMEWRLGDYDTNFKHVTDKLTDMEVAKKLAGKRLKVEAARILIEGWVEMVHQQAYRAVFADESHELYCTVLYLSLDTNFMPEDRLPLQLTLRAGQELSTTQYFLSRFQDWAASDERSHSLESIGWLLSRPGRPGLVLLWDDLIPHARYQKRWADGRPGEVIRREKEHLTLRILFANGDLQEVPYEVKDPEIEALQPGDRVHYWADLDGKPFLLPEGSFSPYVLRKMKVWDRRDTYAYELDPISIG